MSSHITLSVGIPAYNQGPYLRQTLDSVLEQTEPAEEIVVSDNFSTDETADILKEYASRVRVVHPPRHMGMIEHWDFVLTQLKSDWIALLSSDDMAKPVYIETLKRGAARDAGAVLVRAGWETIDEAGMVLTTHHLLSVGKRVVWPETLYENLLGPKTSFAAFAARRDALEKIGGFPDSCRLYGDWGCWLRLSPLGSFIYEDALISQYRTGDRSPQTDRRAKASVEDYLEIATHILPGVVSARPGADMARVSRAQRMRLRNILEEIDSKRSEIRPETLTVIHPLLEAWSRFVGGKDLLARFDAGKIAPGQLSPRVVIGRLRAFARNIVQRLHS